MLLATSGVPHCMYLVGRLLFCKGREWVNLLGPRGQLFFFVLGLEQVYAFLNDLLKVCPARAVKSHCTVVSL